MLQLRKAQFGVELHPELYQNVDKDILFFLKRLVYQPFEGRVEDGRISLGWRDEL